MSTPHPGYEGEKPGGAGEGREGGGGSKGEREGGGGRQRRRRTRTKGETGKTHSTVGQTLLLRRRRVVLGRAIVVHRLKRPALRLACAEVAGEGCEGGGCDCGGEHFNSGGKNGR